MKDDLTEGHLYVVKNGELKEIAIDPEDTMQKVRITEDAVTAANNVQKKMRKLLKGYKPDLSMICSALIEKTAEDESADEIVRSYVLKTFEAST